MYDQVDLILNELKKIEEIIESNLVDGAWKILLKIETKDPELLREIIQWKIRKIIEIKSTLTLVEYIA